MELWIKVAKIATSINYFFEVGFDIGEVRLCQVWEIYGGNSGNSGHQVQTYKMLEGTSASAYVLHPFQTLVPRFQNEEDRGSEIGGSE